MTHPRRDYIIMDHTHASWPGSLAYRTASSWRGYPTMADAESRITAVIQHYHARYGCAPGDLRIYRRHHGVVVR